MLNLKPIRNKIVFIVLLATMIGHLSNWLQFVILVFSNGKEIILKFKSGLKFKVAHRLDAYVIREVFFERIYDFKLKSPKFIIDIGAHIGAFTVFASRKYPMVTIYSYEPNRETFRMLQFNIKANKIINVKARQIGIAGKTGKRAFLKHKLSGLSGLFEGQNLVKGDKITKAIIKTLSLDDIFEGEKISSCDLIKMDCEGSEYEILLNTSALTISKIKNFIIEYHKGITKFSDKDLATLLKKNGYKVKVTKNYYDDSIGIITATR